MQMLTKLRQKVQNIIEHFVVPERDRDRFLIIFAGHVFFQTVYAALKYDLFTILGKEGHLTAEQIGTRLGIQRQPLRILLLGLVTAKVLRKKGDRYSNAKISKILLDRRSPRNITAYFELQHYLYYRGMPYFYDAIRTGKNVGVEAFDGEGDTIYERLGADPHLKGIFQDAMHEISLSANEALANSIDLSTRRFVVDIGGGDGTNMIALCRKFPHLQGAVFDLPITKEIAEANVLKHGLAGRISFIGGECFKDSWPAQADTFLLCHFCTIWSEEKNRLLFSNAYNALQPGGRLIVFNQMQNDSEDGPVVAAIGSPYFLTIATGEGMLYTWREYKAWMEASGFKKVEVVRLPTYHGAIIGTK